MDKPSDLQSAFLKDRDTLRALAAAMLRDSLAADDVLQELWIASTERPSNTIESPSQWLRAVTRNIARKKLRTKARRARREEISARPDFVESTLQAIEKRDVCDYVRDSVNQLPEPRATILRLYYLEERSIEEIGAELRRSPKTIRNQLVQARSELRQRLTSEFGDERIWSIGLILALRWERSDLPKSLTRGALASNLLVALAVLLPIAIPTWWFTMGQRNRNTGDGPTELAEVENAQDAGADSALGSGLGNQEGPASERSPAGRGGQASDEEPLARLSLEVLTATGTRIPNATIHVGDFTPGRTRSRSVTTDDSGKIELPLWPKDAPESLPIGARFPSAAIRATAAGYEQSDVHFIELEGSSSRTFRIRLGESPRSLLGSTTGLDGAPLAGVEVRLMKGIREVPRSEDGALLGALEPCAVSDEQGRFEFRNLKPLSYTLLCWKSGFELLTESVDLESGNITGHSSVLSPTAPITGRVELVDGSAVEGAEVWLETYSSLISNPIKVTSDADGRFLLDYTFGAGPADLVAEGDDLSARQSVQIVPGESLDVVVKLSEANTLRLRVEDESGAPVPDCMLKVKSQAMSWTAAALTDELGQVSLQGCPRVPLIVSLRDPKRIIRLGFSDHMLPGPGEEPHVLVLDRTEIAPARLTGRLRIATPVLDRSVAVILLTSPLHVSDRAFRDTSTGEFAFTGLAPGTYHIFLDAQDLGLLHQATLSLGPGESRELGELTLPDPLDLNISWVWPDAHSVSPVKWTLIHRHQFENGEPPYWTSVAQGVQAPPAKMRILPGMYSLFTELSDGSVEQRGVAATGGTEWFLESGPDSRGSIGLVVYPNTHREESGRVQLWRVPNLPAAQSSPTELLTLAESEGTLLFEDAFQCSGTDFSYHDALAKRGKFIAIARSDSSLGAQEFSFASEGIINLIPIRILPQSE